MQGMKEQKLIAELAWHAFCMLRMASDNLFLLIHRGLHWSSSLYVLSWAELLRHTSLQPSIMESIFNAKLSSPSIEVQEQIV